MIIFGIELEHPEFQEDYLRDLDEAIEEQGYPTCNSNLMYALTGSLFLQEEADKKGLERFSSQIQEYIQELMEPIEELHEEKENINQYSEEAISITETSHIFQEAVGSFQQADSQIVHGGDIANSYIEGTDYHETLGALAGFESWYSDEIESILDNSSNEPVIDGALRTYTHEEYKQVAIFNGLRELVYRRLKEASFEPEEMAAP
ncbi:hypothetical protein [Halovenus marina]|uniref:hypothetical protein n=1 Tax=Halovenus marina TaxID=3396621 RepID=UPI003F574F8B